MRYLFLAIVSISIVVVAVVFGQTALKEQEVAKLEQTPGPPEIVQTGDLPKGWKLYPKPSSDSDDMTCGNYSYDRAWKVSFGEAGLKIEHSSDDAPRDALPFDVSAVKGSVGVGDGVGRRRVAAKQGDDWLVGFDAGEFGGSLWWFSGDGKRARKLSQGNITHFVDLSGTTYVLEGLDHLDLSRGSVLRVEKTTRGDYVVKKVTDLDGRPCAAAAETPSSFLVLTKNGLRRFRGAEGIEKLAESDYGLLYPTSIAITPNGTVYAGMRNFVTRFVPQGDSYKEEWLVPDSCAHFTVDKRNLRCVCSAEK